MLKSMSVIFTSAYLLSSMDVALRDILSVFVASSSDADSNPVIDTGSNTSSDITAISQLSNNPSGSNIIFDTNPTRDRGVGVDGSIQKIPNPFTNDTQVGPFPAQKASVPMDELNRNDNWILNERNKFPKGPT